MSSKFLLRWVLILFLYLPVGLFVLGSIVFIVYMFWPVNLDDLESPDFSRTPKAKQVFILSHGLKDSSATWAEPLANTLKNRYPRSNVVTLEWDQYSTSPFTCSVIGKRIGEKLASQLVDNDELQTLHLIGHSCGAFVNYGMCTELKRLKKKIYIQTTYLDPVSVYGGVFWNYGVNNFGRCADYSDTFYDTEDNVPGSNNALEHSHSYNVTDFKTLEPTHNSSPHLWPTLFYNELVKNDQISGIQFITPK